MINKPVFSLHNFEGPLDLLFHLIQKNELNLNEIFIKHITDQFLFFFKSNFSMDLGAEFIHHAATLLLLKSRYLLPKEVTDEDAIDASIDPQFTIIHHLVDYCRFKEAAKSLSDREQYQSTFYSRGSSEIGEVPKPLGIDHLSLQDLASIFQQVLEKAKSYTGFIQEESWKVSDKILTIRSSLKESKSLNFLELFSASHCREELIVTFLAMLELMKLGEIVVIKKNNHILIESYAE